MSEYSPARWWRLKGPLLRLEGTNCQHCNTLHLPPRPKCPEPNCPPRNALGQSEIIYEASSPAFDSQTTSS